MHKLILHGSGLVRDCSEHIQKEIFVTVNAFHALDHLTCMGLTLDGGKKQERFIRAANNIFTTMYFA